MQPNENSAKSLKNSIPFKEIGDDWGVITKDKGCKCAYYFEGETDADLNVDTKKRGGTVYIKHPTLEQFEESISSKKSESTRFEDIQRKTIPFSNSISNKLPLELDDGNNSEFTKMNPKTYLELNKNVLGIDCDLVTHFGYVQILLEYNIIDFSCNLLKYNILSSNLRIRSEI